MRRSRWFSERLALPLHGRNLLVRRLTEESGMALVMAVGITLTMTISLMSVLLLTSESGRHAQTSNAGQKASALADAGINNAVAQIAAQYPTFIAGIAGRARAQRPPAKRRRKHVELVRELRLPRRTSGP